MTTAKPAGGKRAIEKALPEAGEGYWWRVTLNRKSNVKPIRVELMECFSGNRRAMSTVLGWENTVADPKRVGEAAELILARVADYREVIGEFGGV